MRGEERLDDEKSQLAEPEFLQAIKTDLRDLLKILQPPSTGEGDARG